MMRAVVAIMWALGAGGCDYLFQIDHVSLAADANAPRDVERGDVLSLGTCSARAIDDSFSDPTPCAWGTTFGGAYVTSGGGHLRIAPPSAPYNGGCDTPMLPFADGGVVTEVTQVIEAGVYAYTGIQVYGTFDASIHVTAGQIRFADPSSVPRWNQDEYDPVAMRWLRIRPDRAGNAVVAEYSSDGVTWELLGSVSPTAPATVPEMVKTTLIGGVASGAPTITGIAELSHFTVCM